MGRPVVTTVTLAAASANNIAQSQSLAGAGNLNLNGSAVSGGVAVLDAPRRVIITSAGNDSGLTWTITGTARPEQGGATLVEKISGANAGAASTTQDFATVTSITSSGATALTVTAGTSSTGSGPWVPWDTYQTDFQIALYGVVLSGSPSWQVDYTYDDVFGLWLPSGVSFPRVVGQAIATQTGPKDGSIPPSGGGPPAIVRATRLTLTVVGSVQLTQIQQGI